MPTSLEELDLTLVMRKYLSNSLKHVGQFLEEGSIVAAKLRLIRQRYWISLLECW